MNIKEILTNNTKHYNGKYSDIIKEVPNIYQLLSDLVQNTSLETNDRNEILAVMGYFVFPNDVMNEDILGPIGYMDDVIISLYIINKIKIKYDFQTVSEDWVSNYDLKELLGDKLDMLLNEYKHEFNKIKFFLKS